MKTNGFISYKRSDGSELATIFNNSLEAAGYKIFFDKETLTAGQFIWDIESGIKDTELVIVFLTMDYFRDMANTDNYIRRELDFARQYEKKVFVLTNIDDVYSLVNSREQEIYKWMASLNIEIYSHGDSKRLIEKMKMAFTDIRRTRFDFDETMLQKAKDVIELDVSEGKFKYKGELRFDRPYGAGVLMDDMAQLTYEGEWYGWSSPGLSGKGEIRQTSSGKTIYKGEWHGLKYDGEGTIFGENSTFTGFFRIGEAYGDGVLTFANGSVFKGATGITGFDGKFFGGLDKADGSYYMGQIRPTPGKSIEQLIDSDLKYNGIGKLITADGTKYDGQFSDGEFLRGLKIQKNGFAIDCRFHKGKIDPRFDLTIFDSDQRLIFKGQLAGGKSGANEYYYKNGMVYKGGFAHGVKCGNGFLLNAGGVEIYRGEWDAFEPVKNYNSIGGELYKELMEDEKNTFNSIATLLDDIKYRLPEIEAEIEKYEKPAAALTEEHDPIELEIFSYLLDKHVPDWQDKGSVEFWVDKYYSLRTTTNNGSKASIATYMLNKLNS